MPAERSNANDFRVRRHLRLHWQSLSAGFGLGALLLVLSVVQPFWAGNLIGLVQDSKPVLSTLIVVIALSVATALCAGSQQYVLGRLTEDSVAHWRSLFIQSFFRLPLLGRQQRSGAWFASRMVADPPLVGRFVGGVVVQSVTSVLLAITSLIVLLALDAIVVVIPLTFAVLSMVASAVGAKAVGRDRLAVQQENSRMAETMTRTVDSARLVIASNADPIVDAELRGSVRRARRHGIRLNMVHSLVGPVTMTFMQLAYASVFVVGGWRVASDEMGFPAFITFLMMFGLFQSAVQEVSAIPLGVSECRAALTHLADVSNLSSATDAAEAAATQTQTPSTTKTSAVAFASVEFSYDSDTGSDLVDVSFNLPKRSLSALIGPSGGGKSTCLALMEGFFFAKSGTVQVLGQEVTPGTITKLRDSIGYVDQESVLLGDTIRAMLLYGLPVSLEDRDLQRALNEVGLLNWVEARGGLDRVLDDRGNQISGGQRQLLAIARALLREPQILILDEPTSNLDGFAEARIRSVLRRVSERIAVVITAHRLSTILEADWIVLLDQGRVSAQGTHEQLSHTNDVYRELVASQSGEERSCPAEIAGTTHVVASAQREAV